MITEVCDGKILAAKRHLADYGDELNKLTAINGRKITAKRKLDAVQAKINGLANSKIDHIKIQFRILGKRVKSANDANNLKVITSGEAIAMHTLYYSLKKLESKD